MTTKGIILKLFLIYLLAVGLRLWFINGGTFAFGYDQARDAVYAEEILSGNLKIFGPTASGTNDTIFHGVIYYYLLSFFHIFSENPIFANYFLAIVTSLSILPIFLLSKHFTKNDSASLISALLAAISYEQITAGTWLSNPAPAILTIPCFMYFWIKLSSNFNLKNMIWSMLFLGLSVQFIFFEFFWVIAPVILFVYQLSKNRWQMSAKNLKIWATGIIVFTITISSIILTEAIMIQRGILNFNSISSFNSGAANTPFDLLFDVIKLWINKVSQSISPRIGLLGLFPLFAYLFNPKYHLKLKYLKWLLATPLVFFLLYFRNNSHLLLGYEALFYILIGVMLADFFHKTKKAWIKNSIVSILIIIFSLFNLSSLHKIKLTHNHPNTTQKGFLYGDQEALVKKAFELSQGENFSIATLTNPYSINVTWGYLFDYFGREHFSYEPTFFGPDQTGLVGSTLLERTEKPMNIHFAIVEPDTGLDQLFIKKFHVDQNPAGEVIATYSFRKLELIQYKKESF